MLPAMTNKCQISCDAHARSLSFLILFGHSVAYTTAPRL
jgi:hypothetical protein